MEDDDKKIKRILTTLNKQAGSNWEEVEGYHAMMSVNKSPIGGYDFNSTSGMIVKGFINHSTGEIKTYYFKFTAVGENGS